MKRKKEWLIKATENDRTIRSLEEIRELERKAELWERRLRIGAGICLALLPMWAGFLKEEDYLGAVFGLCFVASAVFIGISSVFRDRYLKEFNKDYKKIIVGTAAADLFETFAFYPDLGFNQRELEKKGLLNLGLDFGSDDLITGEYHDVQFVRADIELGYKNRFKGNWTIFSFNKPFKTELQVSCGSLTDQSNLKTGIFISDSERRTRFITGNEQFDQQFACSAQDLNEAATLLTPSVMTKLLRFRKRTGYSFVIGWVKNNIHLIIQTDRNIVSELKPSGKIYDEEEIEKTKKDFGIICEIIDDMMMSRSIYADYVMSEMENLKQTEAVERTVRQ